MSRLIAFLMIAVFALPAFSTEIATEHVKLCREKLGTDLKFPAKKKFQIVKYDANTDTYDIQSPDFPGEGLSIVAFQTILKSVKELRPIESMVKRKPEEIVDNVYTSEKDLPTLFAKEKEAREGCRKAR